MTRRGRAEKPTPLTADESYWKKLVREFER